MGHTQRYVFYATRRRAFDQLIEERDDCLATFQRESLLAEILCMKETLKLFGRN